MSMVFFYGLAIESSKVLGFEVSAPSIKLSGCAGGSWQVTSNTCPVVANMAGDKSLTLNDCYIPSLNLSGNLSEIPLNQMDFASMSDFVRAQADFVRKQAFEAFKSQSDELVKKVCAEWNELTKQQGGAA